MHFEHFNARSLHARTGRFTSVDPVNVAAISPQGWNGYSYALNNPLRFIDPTGMLTACVDWGTRKHCEEVYEAPGRGAGGGRAENCKFCDVDGRQDGGGVDIPAPGTPTSPVPPPPPRPPPEPGGDQPKQDPKKKSSWLPSSYCGGGFPYAGIGGHAGVAHAEALALVNYDSHDGGSHGYYSGLGLSARRAHMKSCGHGATGGDVPRAVEIQRRLE